MATQIIVNAIILGALYALIGISFHLIYHTTRVFHVAHGAIYTAGAYLFYVFAVIAGFWMPLAIALSVAGAALLGILIEVAVLIPFVRDRTTPHIAFLSSFGGYIVLVNLIALLFGNDAKILKVGIEPAFWQGSFLVTRVQFFQFIVAAVLVLAVLTVLHCSRFGFLVRALADNEELLRVQGINSRRVRMTVTALASALAGVAALLAGLDFGIEPHMGIEVILVAVSAVIVGGTGNYVGTVVAAILIGLLHNVVIWQTSAQWMSSVTFTILVLVVLVRSQGLFSRMARVEEKT